MQSTKLFKILMLIAIAILTFWVVWNVSRRYKIKNIARGVLRQRIEGQVQRYKIIDVEKLAPNILY